jgi:protein TonB
VKREGGRSTRWWIYAVSAAVHGAFWLIIASLPAHRRSQVVAIDFSEIKRSTVRPRPPAPVKPPAASARLESKALPIRRAVRPEPKEALAPATKAPAAPALGPTGFADLRNVALGGGGPGASAVASSPPSGRGGALPKLTAHRAKLLLPEAQEACAEALVKPKVKRPGQITYTKEAQEAEIEGVVRVEVTVDESGNVLATKILSGLGYGLDERAAEAARSTLFDPATLCGKPVVATKVLAFTFELR